MKEEIKEAMSQWLDEFVQQKPEQVTTTKGLMDVNLLEKTWDFEEDDDQGLYWIEYSLDGEMVHRSVHIYLKRNVAAEGIAAMMA